MDVLNWGQGISCRDNFGANMWVIDYSKLMRQSVTHPSKTAKKNFTKVRKE